MANINCSEFKKNRQNELKTFADTVYHNTTGKAAYAPFQQALADMNAAADAYQQALVEAADGGKSKIRLKDEAKALLLQQLTRVAKLMDIEWMDNTKDYLKQEAGFTLNKTPERKNVTFVEPPTLLEAYNEKARGLITVRWKKSANTVTVGFETLEGEGTWQNGLFSDKESMELTYPFGTTLKIRAKTIGPDSITSIYTEPVEVNVS